ncbi:MAG: hypothetical protein ACREDA_12400, partial [Methylocella sp.]
DEIERFIRRDAAADDEENALFRIGRHQTRTSRIRQCYRRLSPFERVLPFECRKRRGLRLVTRSGRTAANVSPIIHFVLQVTYARRNNSVFKRVTFEQQA